MLFAAYLVLFSWLLTKIAFFKNSGLNAAQLIIIFLLKVLAGIFYGWIGVYYGELAQMVDTWSYHYQSLTEYQILLNEPKVFFSTLTGHTYESGYGGFFSTESSWWNDLKGIFFIKILALLNLFSFGNYYVNVIFYSFITLFGPVAFYRVAKDVFKGPALALLAATFLVPSFLYWTSGIHKDGFIFLGLAIIIYHTYYALKENKLTIHRLLYIAFGLLMVVALRNFLIIILAPALVAWILSARLKTKPHLTFLGLYLLFALLFFFSKYIHPALDFPAAVAERQQAFLSLSGGSAVAVNNLEPTLGGFIKNAPQAISLAAIRPYPTDVRHLLSLAAAVEITVILFLLAVFLFVHKKIKTLSPFVLFCLAFSFSALLMIGYTVNFLGAIVRYRSIVLPFLIVPMVAQWDWLKLKNIFKSKL